MESTKKRRIETEQATKTPAYNVSHFDLTSLPASDLSILSSEFVQVTHQTKTSDIIEYYIPPSTSTWISLKEIFLVLGLKVETAAGAKLGSSSKTSVGNLIAGSLFETLDVKLNGISITSGGSIYSYTSYFSDVVFKDTETIKRKGPLYGLYLKDKTSPVDAENEAYKSLLALAQLDSFEVISPIFHGFFDTERYLPPGNSLSLRFRLSPNKFYLNSPVDLASGAVFTDRISISKCVLDVRHIVAHSKVDSYYEAALNKNMMMSFPFTDSQTFSFIVPKGMLTYTSEVLFNSLPSFCCFGLVKATSYYGSHKECPFQFLPHNLNGYRFTINNDDVLFNTPRFSVADNDYIRHYNQLLQIVNSKGQSGYNLSKVQFTEQGYFIMPLINSNNGKQDRYTVGRQGVCRLQLSFSTNTTENLACIVFSQFPKLVQFNKTNVFVKDDVNIET